MRQLPGRGNASNPRLAQAPGVFVRLDAIAERLDYSMQELRSGFAEVYLSNCATERRAECLAC